MEQDIHKLIERFMAGLTSIEEERYIADYLRTHEVDGDLLPYKRMFAWFDEGMPAKRPAKAFRHTAVLRKLSYFIMAAAAAALLLVVIWPRTEPAQMANNVPVEMVPVEKKPVAKPDTLANDTTTTIVTPKKKTRRHIRRDRFKAMPPKVYMAKAAPDSSANEMEILTEKAVRESEIQQERILNAIYEEYRKIELGVNLYLTAMENYDLEEECY